MEEYKKIGISKQDAITFEGLINLKVVTKAETHQMQYLLNKYIDSKLQLCSHCSAAIRNAHKKIVSFYQANITEIKEVQKDEVETITLVEEVEVVEDKKVTKTKKPRTYAEKRK
jgi:hypothetical protein